MWIAAWLACASDEPAPTGPGAASSAAPRAQAEAFFAQRPIYEQPAAPSGPPPAGLPDVTAETCATCHPDHAAEWRLSTHAHAWVDRQLQAEMTKSENRWLCNNCHTPRLDQMAQWPVGLIDGDVERPIWADNPDFRPAFRDEGIGCAACHIRDGVILGPRGLPTDAHPTRRDANLTSEGVCLRCHQAVAEYPGKSFTCTFHTGEEWAAGPAGRAGQPCQTCHMPVVSRPSAIGGPVRESRRHGWPGGGIPKEAGVYPPADWLGPGLQVRAEGEAARVRVHLDNVAGHAVPTGDPERFYQIELAFYAADGSALPGWTHRVGQVWTWWPTPEKQSDNRVMPGTSQTLDAPRPPDAARATLRVTRHRMTPEAAAHHALDGYPIAAPVLEVPVALP